MSRTPWQDFEGLAKKNRGNGNGGGGGGGNGGSGGGGSSSSSSSSNHNNNSRNCSSNHNRSNSNRSFGSQGWGLGLRFSGSLGSLAKVSSLPVARRKLRFRTSIKKHLIPEPQTLARNHSNQP